jgi:hypothetical protein
MQIVLSVDKAMEKWLSHPQVLPHMPVIGLAEESTDMNAIRSHEQQQAWQCSVMEHPAADERYTVLMVESYSRYCVLLTYETRPSLSDVETDFIARYIEDLTRFAVASGRIRRDQVNELFHQFMTQSRDYRWWQNCDQAVHSHLVDYQCHVMRLLVDSGNSYLSDPRAQEMAEYLNANDTSAPQGQVPSRENFMPVERFLQDGLYRYAKGMAEEPFAVDENGNFANPYSAHVKAGNNKDNVVSLRQFVKR